MGMTAQSFILQPQHSLKDLCHGRSILPFVAGLSVCSNIQSSLMRMDVKLGLMSAVCAGVCWLAWTHPGKHPVRGVGILMHQ